MAKRAIVVVHGIGQAKPYEMARVFADGLRRVALQGNDGIPWVTQVAPEVAPVPSAQPPGRIYRFVRSTAPDAYVDIYEAYWAPLTAGGTNFLSIVWWLLVNTFVPTRLLGWPSRKTFSDVGFATAFLVLVAAVYYWLFGGFILATRDVLKELAKELAGTNPPVPLVHPLPPLSMIFGASLRELGHLCWDGWGAPWSVALGNVGAGSLGNVLAPVTFGWLVATVVGVYALAQFLFRLAELAGDLAGGGPGRAALFASPLRPVANLVVLAVWGGLYLAASGYVTPAFFAFGYIYIAFQLVNLWVKKYFVDYIGDIQIYVTRDSKSGRFVIRDEIRERAIDAITSALLSAEEYEEVLVFGHSLGSVIGLDAIRELRRALGGIVTPAQFNRLTAFVTFGSPLEKTRFFFERVSPDDPGPWRDFLEDIELTFLADAETRRIYWTNFWYFADLVANSLGSYNSGLASRDGEERKLVRIYELPARRGRIWVHSDYAMDDNFLKPVYRRLTQGAPGAVPQYVPGHPETVAVG